MGERTMCGRFTLLADAKEIKEAFNISHPLENYKPSYNIAPGQQVLAIIHDGYEKRAGYLRWGLVPSWAKDEKIGYKMINARSETAHEKPSFKHLMAQKRCLIVADSFYEWKQNSKNKVPHRIQLKNRRLFVFAGLWDKWIQGETTLFTCTLLTKQANRFMKDIHHRMPIILPKDKENEWIQPEKWLPYEAKQFLDRIQDEEFSTYPVSTYVNKASNNDMKCIESIV